MWNGSPETTVRVTLEPEVDSLYCLIRTIAKAFKLKSSKKCRLFTYEGVELSEDDFLFIKNGDEYFFSKGKKERVTSLGSDFKYSQILSLYKVQKHIAKGGFGTVSLAVHRKNGEKVAIKKFNNID